MADNAITTPKRSSPLAFLALGSAVLIYFLIVITNLAERTGVGAGFSRWLLVPTLVLVVISAAAAWRSFQQSRWVRAPLLVSGVILVVQGGLILIRLNAPTPPEFFAAYISSILLVHGMAITAAVVAFRDRAQTGGSLVYQTPFARLSLVALVATFVSITTGVFVTMSGAAAVCSGWVLCNGLELPQTFYEWLHIIHRLAVGLSGLAMAWLLILAWRRQRSQTSILVLATASAILFAAQGLVGAALVTKNFPLDLVGLHTATAAAAWALLIVLVIEVGLAGRSLADEALDALPTYPAGQRARDFLALTKPIIVLLLLVTTFTGMVVGAQALPSFSLLFWTLLGGALAAGGSGAINQYIDRDLDKLMTRTARRPLAANRLTPAEGLAFGVGLCLVSFYLLAVYTNLLAALLAVVGMFYYVWVYSILLKKSTVQNIVIGGGAGAVPPLVGWAAATGELSLPALMLFVIIFFWTPPHFWALALVRIKDYARGGVPMLPVVQGEAETRKQILIYTVELVAITMLAPLVGIGGWVYFVGAFLLGAGLLVAALRVWNEPSANPPMAHAPDEDTTPRTPLRAKHAWRMYRYSSMYLALLFIVLVIDALV